MIIIVKREIETLVEKRVPKNKLSEKLFFIFLVSPLFFLGQASNFSYATPQNTYVGSSVEEVKALNKSAAAQYDINKSTYNQTISSLNKQIAETNGEGNKEAIKFALAEYNKALQKYIDRGNWQDAYATLEIAKSKIQENYDSYLNKSMAEFMANTFYDSGISKQKSGDNKGACEDLKKAAEYGHKEAKNAITLYCK